MGKERQNKAGLGLPSLDKAVEYCRGLTDEELLALYQRLTQIRALIQGQENQP